jgi:MFS family permease
MNNVFSAVASDWHAGPQLVALVTGVFSGIVSALGCLLGGWSADRLGRWWAYFGSGIALAVVAIHVGRAVDHNHVWHRRFGLRVFRRRLLRLFLRARRSRHWSRRRFHQIRHLPVDRKHSGCLHDCVQRLGPRPFRKIWMLNGEALPALVCIAGGLIALQQIRARQLPGSHETLVRP